jgi:hypothetical protein
MIIRSSKSLLDATIVLALGWMSLSGAMPKPAVFAARLQPLALRGWETGHVF